ncbi:MAG TPA: DNA-formamidopyrimidine glycosylase family protein [Mycobacteriales bacterium]|jgi:DNA-formamidopyrimidine glycosylase|nr:DNA-formamidopyrimidine glycosylase family protein [Mycobacteriales bacterium]
MPEGHTLHRLAREHNALFGGRPVRLSSPQGRFADGAARLDGRVLRSVSAYGKHLFLDFGAGDVLHVHLGLYGTWLTGRQPAPPPRGALRLRLENDDAYADLRGPTACDLLTRPDVDRILDRLGSDPLRRGADPDAVWTRLHRRRTPIGAVLLDQAVLAGVGNVFRAEALFVHRISPYRPADALDREQFDALWATLTAMLKAGVRAGRIVTTRPEHRERRRGPATREDAHYVYRRTGLPCRLCHTPVRTAELAARNAYWCPTCQDH